MVFPVSLLFLHCYESLPLADAYPVVLMILWLHQQQELQPSPQSLPCRTQARAASRRRNQPQKQPRSVVFWLSIFPGIPDIDDSRIKDTIENGTVNRCHGPSMPRCEKRCSHLPGLRLGKQNGQVFEVLLT
jgi:hypothetical protein